MGFRPSPYFATKDMIVIEETVRGLRSDTKNMFRWSIVVFNLPGMIYYNPLRSWVYHVREDRSLTVDIFWYIGDGRPTAATAWKRWKVATKFCCTLIFHDL